MLVVTGDWTLAAARTDLTPACVPYCYHSDRGRRLRGSVGGRRGRFSPRWWRLVGNAPLQTTLLVLFLLLNGVSVVRPLWTNQVAVRIFLLYTVDSAPQDVVENVVWWFFHGANHECDVVDVITDGWWYRA